MEQLEYSQIINQLVCEENILGAFIKKIEKVTGAKSLWCCCALNSKGEVDVDNIKKNLKKKNRCCNKIIKNKNVFFRGFKQAEKHLKNSVKNNHIQYFECKYWKKSLCIPLSHEEYVYGVIIICNIKNKVDNSIKHCFAAFKDYISDLLIKEYQLRDLKETLHPRAIALSTIHTVHRIISSTLELKELLPKIARLCIQVVRANRCSIYIVSEDSKYLIPQVTIDLQDPESKSRKIIIGKGNIGKVAKTARAFKSDKCIAVPLLNTDIIGVITVRNKQGGGKFNVYDEEILSVLSEQASVAIRNAELYEEQKKMVTESVKSLSALLNIQIPSPYVHDIGFIDIIEAIGEKAGFNQTEINTLRYSAMLRNVARFGIPGEILLKPDGLTSSEYELIKRRIKEIVSLIKPLKVLEPAIPILIHHREKYDGTGYPSGLKGKEIPLGARIMALVDAFEAMITYRPYKGEMNIKQAVEEIKSYKGTQFDPDIVEIFLDLYNKGIIEDIVRTHKAL